MIHRALFHLFVLLSLGSRVSTNGICNLNPNFLRHRIDVLGSQNEPEGKVSVDVGIEPMELLVSTQNVSLAMRIQLQWTDDRYVIRRCRVPKTIRLDSSTLRHIWRPPIYFDSDVIVTSGGIDDVLNSWHLSIDTSGRIAMVFSAQVVKFPFDNFVCSTSIASHVDASYVAFHWESGKNRDYAPSMTKFQPSSQFAIPEFTLSADRASNQLNIELFFDRIPWSYLSQFYLPTIISLAIIYASYLTPIDYLVVRVVISSVAAIVSLLAYAITVTSSSYPPKGMFTAVDIWFTAVMVAVCASFITSLVSNWQSRNRSSYQTLNRAKAREITDRSDQTNCDLCMIVFTPLSTLLCVLWYIVFVSFA